MLRQIYTIASPSSYYDNIKPLDGPESQHTQYRTRIQITAITPSHKCNNAPRITSHVCYRLYGVYVLRNLKSKSKLLTHITIPRAMIIVDSKKNNRAQNCKVCQSRGNRPGNYIANRSHLWNFWGGKCPVHFHLARADWSVRWKLPRGSPVSRNAARM